MTEKGQWRDGLLGNLKTVMNQQTGPLNQSSDNSALGYVLMKVLEGRNLPRDGVQQTGLVPQERSPGVLPSPQI